MKGEVAVGWSHGGPWSVGPTRKIHGWLLASAKIRPRENGSFRAGRGIWRERARGQSTSLHSIPVQSSPDKRAAGSPLGP